MEGAEIEQERKNDCLDLIKHSTNPGIKNTEILDLSKQTGGLFNYLLRVKTAHGTYFFKQYLDDVSNETYSNIPKIPASERVFSAYSVQTIAQKSLQGIKDIQVPEIVGYDKSVNAFLMTNGFSMLFIDYLSNGNSPPIFLKLISSSLAHLHKYTYNKYDLNSIFANRKFRDFKLKLQYDDITSHLDQEESKIVLETKKNYMEKIACILHGDINSRNILCAENEISLIDFEQSHLGSSSYDLAYILSEIVISEISFHGFDKMINSIKLFIEAYFLVFEAIDRCSIEKEIVQHLATQILYRFWGPSRASWTFYCNDDQKNNYIEYARSLLKKSGDITKIAQIN